MIDNSSFWPNGVKIVNGHGVFYKLGTNKVKVPTTCWPKGNKFVYPFVYDKDNNLVDFVDTKAMTSDGDSIYLPYELIEADFPNITQGKLQIHAPKATVKKASWKGSNERIDIPEAQFKYKGCKNVDHVNTVDSDYKTSGIVNGNWSEPLWDLEDGNPENLYNTGMFRYCTNLTSFSSDLPSLTNGNGMFKYCSNLESFSSDLSNLTNGNGMFDGCSQLTSFTSDLPSLTNGAYMFYYCSNLTTFNVNLSSLTDGHGMFRGCTNLESFTSDLSNLTDGTFMFYENALASFSTNLSSLTDATDMFRGCTNLTSFSSDLSSLTDGGGMFRACRNLTSFNIDLPSLTNGSDMFNDCSNLTSFSSDLSSLTNGYQMFEGCSNLTSFSSDLSSLTYGSWMFSNCYLNTASVQNIADTINTYSATIHIGIANSEPNEQEKSAFNTMVSKGWTVYVNGSAYTSTSPAAITTLDENGIETTTPIPYWAKPVPSDEQNAKYTDSEGNYYNIVGAQFIYGDNLESYGMFTCEEDAAANMRLTPYTKPQTEIEKQ